MYIGLHVKHSLFCIDLNETWSISTDFWKKKKYSNIKFYENSSNGNQSCSMRRYRRTDMTKLIVALRNFANSPKKEWMS